MPNSKAKNTTDIDEPGAILDVFIQNIHLQQTATSVGDLEALAHNQEQSNAMQSYCSADTGLEPNY